MRTVTRCLLTTGAMLIGVTAAAAQELSPRPAVLIKEIPLAMKGGPARSPAVVIERLVSFDANADERISRDELPERMQGLVARGDKNGDAVLDSDEIRTLVMAASSERITVSFRRPPPEGLKGVVSDLKLPAAKHTRALAIVSAYEPRNVNDPASALLGEMKTLLDDEEYANFVAAATRLMRGPDFRFRTVDGAIGGVVGGVFVQPSGRR